VSDFDKIFKTIVLYELNTLVDEVFVSKLFILNVPKENFQNLYYVSCLFAFNFLVVELLDGVDFVGSQLCILADR